MSNYIGLDLGGTKIAGAILDRDTGIVTARLIVPTEAHKGPDAVLSRMADVCRALCTQADITIEDIAGIGVGVPGTFNEQGETLVVPNLPGEWNGKPVIPILEQHLERPCALVNDARAFTLAEATLGAGRSAACVVGVTLGTGIGGGIVINGRLHLGLGMGAGEIGHQSIDMYGSPDGTGNAGGWEGLASGPAIAAMGMKAVAQGVTTHIGDLVDFDLNRITPDVIMRAAEAGDPIAQDILKTAGFYLGTGLANLIIILAPDIVVIGGGVANLGDWIMTPIWETLRQRVFTVPLDRVQIRRAELGSDAGMIGAALWASQQDSGKFKVQSSK